MPQPLPQPALTTNLNPMSSPTRSAPLPDARHQLMILRIRRLLIQHLEWLPIQLRKFSLETDPIHPCNITPIIVFQEQRQIVSIAKLSPLDLQLLDIIGL